MELKKITIVFAVISMMFFIGCKNNGDDEAGDFFPQAGNEDKYIEAFGKVTPEIIKNINLVFPAEVEKIHVKKGARVKKGDNLITFSTDDIEKTIRTKEYELLEANIELRKISLQKYNLESGMAQGKIKRRDNLELDLKELKKQIAKATINENNIVCDVENGIITYIGYKEGDFINLETSVLTIIDADSIIVEADVPEEFIKDVKIGNKATIIPVADPDKTYDGKISRISNIATESNGETIITVDVIVLNRDDFLLPNYNVDVRFFTD